MSHDRYALYKIAKTLSKIAIVCIIVVVIATVVANSGDDNHQLNEESEGPSNHETVIDSNAELQTSTENLNVGENTASIPEKPEKPTVTDTEDMSAAVNTTDTAEGNEERTEEEQQPQRENVLYYVLDSGYRFDFPVEYQDYLWEKCKEYEIQDHYELILAQMYHESRFDPSVISRTNDYGLMQINVCNHSWLKEQLGISDFLDPYDSIDAGVHIMGGYLQKYDVHKALMSYNMGEGGMKRSGLSESTYSRGVISDINLLHVLEPENVSN